MGYASLKVLQPTSRTDSRSLLFTLYLFIYVLLGKPWFFNAVLCVQRERSCTAMGRSVVPEPLKQTIKTKPHCRVRNRITPRCLERMSAFSASQQWDVHVPCPPVTSSAVSFPPCWTEKLSGVQGRKWCQHDHSSHPELREQ